MEKGYEKAIKHMKKITQGRKRNAFFRPIFNGVYHCDETISATDGHRLLYVKLENENFDEQVLNVKTGEVIDGYFPDAERLFISDEDVNLHLSASDIKVLKNVLSCMKSANYKKIKLTVQDGYWTIKPYIGSESEHNENLNISYKIDEAVGDVKKERVIFLNYFIQAIDFIKDTKEDTNLLMVDNSLAPIEFTDVDHNSNKSDFKYKYIVSPMRTK